MFGGTWNMVEPLDEPWLEGRVQLLIGHFGPDLVGTIRYLDEFLLPTPDCKCGLIDGSDVDLDAETFAALTDDCNGVLIWMFELTEDADGNPLLNAMVLPSAPPGTSPIEVQFELEDRFIADENKECTPE